MHEFIQFNSFALYTPCSVLHSIVCNIVFHSFFLLIINITNHFCFLRSSPDKIVRIYCPCRFWYISFFFFWVYRTRWFILLSCHSFAAHLYLFLFHSLSFVLFIIFIIYVAVVTLSDKNTIISLIKVYWHSLAIHKSLRSSRTHIRYTQLIDDN